MKLVLILCKFVLKLYTNLWKVITDNFHVLQGESCNQIMNVSQLTIVAGCV